MGKINLLNQIAYSLPYGDRMQPDVLSALFSDVRKGDLVLDPFCGAGTPLLVALQKGAGVVAGDLDPVAVLLTRALLQPMGLFSLREDWKNISEVVADQIQGRYTTLCPGCRREVPFAQLLWKGTKGKIRPDAVTVTCNVCGIRGKTQLTGSQAKRQVLVSGTAPGQWFPAKKNPGTGSIDTCYMKDLFTGRNLASLADLLHAIQSLPAGRNREAFQAVFVAVLLRCMTKGISGSAVNVLSNLSTPEIPKASAPSTEVNVWSAFEHQFHLFLNCKKEINSRLSFLQISDSMDDFEKSDDHLYISHSDCLSLSIPQKRNITHVFLDPPGDGSDVRQCMSGLQASWLSMKYDRHLLWGSGLWHNEEQVERFAELLERVIQKTASSSRIIYSHRSSAPESTEILQETVAGIGCQLQEITPLPGAFSHLSGRYYTIIRNRKRKNVSAFPSSDSDIHELFLYLRASAFLKNGKSAEKIHDDILPMIRENLKEHYSRLTKQECRTIVSDSIENERAYHLLCMMLLSIILSEDHYQMVFPAKDQLRPSEVMTEIMGYPDSKTWGNTDNEIPDVDMIAENKDGKKIFFCFYDSKRVKQRKQVAGDIVRQDKSLFESICYLVFTDRSEMNACRQVEWADNWPRGFLICFPDLVRKAVRIKPDRFGVSAERFFNQPILVPKQTVKHFKAEVIQNKPVGPDESPMHYKLAFQTSDMKNIGPGQFIMVDPLPDELRKKMDQIRYKNLFAAGKRQGPDLSPKSYLKRPFGVQRAYYQYFEWGYHDTLSLPTILAGITHTVFPHKFEIFYKVMEGGIGTREMTGLKKGDRIRVLGPLGKYTHIPGWRSQGIDEVHLVGGGVGMAPLVFFGQALKFYAFKVKAFIGIDRIASLAEAPYGRSFSEESGKAYVYIEELARIGLKPDELYLSREHTENEELSEKIKKENYHCGLVTEQYRSCLEKRKAGKKILIVACGPKPMLIALQKIASEFEIPMKVLLEKRMGCGIGVCMSCVCRTQKNHAKQYSRVCVDGPVFDANEIDWEKL